MIGHGASEHRFDLAQTVRSLTFRLPANYHPERLSLLIQVRLDLRQRRVSRASARAQRIGCRIDARQAKEQNSGGHDEHSSGHAEHDSALARYGQSSSTGFQTCRGP